MDGWLTVIFLCIWFCGLLKLTAIAIDEELAPRRKARRMKRQQARAMEVAEDLIVFDQTMTREHLIRVWEEMKL